MTLYAFAGPHTAPEYASRVLQVFGSSSLPLPRVFPGVDGDPFVSLGLCSDARSLPTSATAVGAAHSDAVSPAVVAASGQTHPTTEAEGICISGGAGVGHHLS